MILIRIIMGFFLLYSLNGCVQNATLLGPAYTFISTGNVYQTGLSYGSNQVIKKVTKKKKIEDVKKKNFQEEENYAEFDALIKNRIEKTRKILNSTSQ